MKKDKTIKLSVPFTAICINNASKPREIPQNKWLELEEYTVIGVAKSLDGTLGFKLEEITLGQESFPYGCFSSKRFGIPIQDNSDALANELADLGIEVEKLELEKIE